VALLQHDISNSSKEEGMEREVLNGVEHRMKRRSTPESVSESTCAWTLL
jgi:hypothetical protein